MELSSTHSPLWAKLVPLTVLALLLIGAASILWVNYAPLPDDLDSLTVKSVSLADSGTTLPLTDAAQLSESLQAAGPGKPSELSDRLPILAVTFTDGSSWQIAFTKDPSTLRCDTDSGSFYLYAPDLSSALSRMWYTHTLPKPTAAS